MFLTHWVSSRLETTAIENLVGQIAEKTERMQLHFLSDIFAAVASFDLRVPNIKRRSRQKNTQVIVPSRLSHKHFAVLLRKLPNFHSDTILLWPGKCLYNYYVISLKKWSLPNLWFLNIHKYICTWMEQRLPLCSIMALDLGLSTSPKTPPSL